MVDSGLSSLGERLVDCRFGSRHRKSCNQGQFRKLRGSLIGPLFENGSNLRIGICVTLLLIAGDCGFLFKTELLKLTFIELPQASLKFSEGYALLLSKHLAQILLRRICGVLQSLGGGTRYRLGQGRRR